jgi:N-acetylmuramoyl-L-alanine amidase
MKKHIALMLGFVMLGTNVYGQITTNYIDGDVTTSNSNYSISGSSDPNYPLYINGTQLDRTDSGYFSTYVDLNDGENKFVLENTTDSKTITINKTTPQASSGTGTDTEDVFKDMDAVGVVNRNYPTLRSRPDEADDDLIGPYIKNTLVHITGENSDYYRTANGAYLYTDSVELVNTPYGDNDVKSVTANDDIIEFKMDRAAEYNFDFTSDSLKLTLYDTTATADDIKVAGGLVESITKESSSPAVYNIKFKEANSVVGYMCYFEDDGTFKIDLNERDVLKDKSLNGIKIVLDAGHGGAENGAAGLGAIPEKDITLAITNYLGEYLTNKGAEIVYTRPDDSTVALTARTAKIIAEEPDISVSIHCNSMNATTDFNRVSGTLNLHTYDTPTQFVEKLTEAITGSTYRKQNLALTRTTVCPAVLIETGFICNPVEYEYLSKDENQKEMAEKIGNAIEQYFYSLDDVADTDESTTEVSTESSTETTTATTVESSTETTTATTVESSTETTTVRRSSGGGSSRSSKKTTTTTTEATTVDDDTETTTSEDDTEVSTEESTETTTEATTTGNVDLSDVDNHWAKDFIASAFGKGYVKGYDDNTYKPEKAVTRAEFIQILYNIFGKEESKDVTFADVKGNEWYYDSLKWGVANGIITGYDDNTFKAGKEISREEAAVILSRCVNIDSNENGVDFKDGSNISAWAKDGVDLISKIGIMKGDDNGNFNPKKSLTRAETAVIADSIL